MFTQEKYNDLHGIWFISGTWWTDFEGWGIYKPHIYYQVGGGLVYVLECEAMSKQICWLQERWLLKNSWCAKDVGGYVRLLVKDTVTDGTETVTVEADTETDQTDTATVRYINSKIQ